MEALLLELWTDVYLDVDVVNRSAFSLPADPFANELRERSRGRSSEIIDFLGLEIEGDKASALWR
jgi:hypothetical protein